MKAVLQFANLWGLASLDNSPEGEKAPGSASQEGAPLLFSSDPGDADEGDGGLRPGE